MSKDFKVKSFDMVFDNDFYIEYNKLCLENL